MSLIRLIKAQLGISPTPANNFTLTAEANDGTMKLARGLAGNTTQDILTVDADGRMAHGIPMSCIRLNTANGYGSTNNKIRRFANIVMNQGNDITYVDSATLGASFIINKSGVYTISYSDDFSVQAWHGLSLNTTVPSTTIPLVPAVEILSIIVSASNGGNNHSHIGWAGYLPSGSVVRAHTDGTSTGGVTAGVQFTIARTA